MHFMVLKKEEGGAGGMRVTRGTLRGYGVTLFNVGKLISRIICQHVQMKKLCSAAVV